MNRTLRPLHVSGLEEMALNNPKAAFPLRDERKNSWFKAQNNLKFQDVSDSEDCCLDYSWLLPVLVTFDSTTQLLTASREPRVRAATHRELLHTCTPDRARCR